MTPKPKTPSGNTTTRLILGLWPMAGVTSVADDATSVATIHAALEAGINHFDTAYSYGYEGRSDHVLRVALSGRTEAVHVIGKAGQRWTAEKKRIVDGRPETLIADAIASLNRCGIERFRYFLLHQPDPLVPVEDSAEAMLELQRRGIAEEVGICNASVEEMEKFASVVPMSATQFGFNMVQQEPSEPVRQWCAAKGVRGFAYWVLMKGFLAGKISRSHQFPPGDSRPNYPIFQPPFREATHRLVDRLAEIAGDLHVPLPALVIAWSVRQQGVDSAIVGALRPDQILESAVALQLELSDQEFAAIAHWVKQWQLELNGRRL